MLSSTSSSYGTSTTGNSAKLCHNLNHVPITQVAYYFCTTKSRQKMASEMKHGISMHMVSHTSLFTLWFLFFFYTIFLLFLLTRNRFNSEKRCTLSYANIQGKKALVDKFRNSSVMEEEPSYQPKIFVSSGEHRGDEEAFPSPTLSSEIRKRKQQQRHNLTATHRPSTFLDYYRHGSPSGDD